MAADPFSGFTNPLASVASNGVQERARMAQYSVIRAADFLQGGRQEEAIQAFKQALALDPANTTASTYIGNISLSLGKYEDAINAFKNLVRQKPNSSDAHIKLANAYITAGKLDLSEQELKTAIRLDPQDPVPEYTLGMQYLQTGKLREAESQFTRVVRMAPSDPNSHYGLGATYNAMERYDKALSSLRTALSLEPNNPPVNYEIGIAYDKLGDKDAAQAELKKLIDARSPLAQDLSFEINRPRMQWIDNSRGSFDTNMGAKTPVWFMDTDLLTADANATFSVGIRFTNEMDVTSVMNPTNWKISRSNNIKGGFYNNMAAVDVTTEAKVAATPTSVTYNAYTKIATVNFTLSQNSDVTATIDPRHLSFKFSGKDALGRTMDQSGDEITGAAASSY